ncbi:hypothetical protein V7S43_017039 [Phytophthora oleae]|uniref:Uncharacterized protein n=1 Tax=Phytophthora oleae TaxID=2107226 RepID=A0ABD3EU04_9STRA
MEVAPAHPIDVVEAAGNNHMEANNAVKTHEPEVVPHAPVEESRPADNSHEGDTCTPAVVLESTVSPYSSRLSESAEVVTPAGTVEVETPHCASDTSTTEAAEKEVVAPALKPVEGEIPAKIVELKAVEQKVEPAVEDTVEQKTKQSVDHEAAIPAQPAPAVTEAKPEDATTEATTSAPFTDPASAPSPIKKAKSEKKNANNDSLASDELLTEVHKFLTLQIAENRCSSHTKEITEFVEKHLNEKQRKRYVAALVDRVVQHFAQEATAKGEEVSIEVQSNICLIEQMFLTLGRRSPLQDMYTAEEEEMLDLLFHSNSSDNLPING